MAIKNALWTRIAKGIISVGKKILDTSIDNNKVSAHKHPEANGETVKSPLSDKNAEKAEVRSIEVSEVYNSSDDDDAFDDFWDFQKRYHTCKVMVNDVNQLFNEKFNVFIEDFDETYKFKLTEDTVLLDVDMPGEYECIFEYEKNMRTKKVTGKILCLADVELYKHFLNIEDLRKRVSNIAGFVYCTPEQRSFILKNTSKPKKTDKSVVVKNDAKETITDIRALETMYYLCKDSLPLEFQFQCNELVKELHRGSKRGAESAMILSDILHTCLPYGDEPQELPSYEECVEILQKYHYGDDGIIEQIARQIRLINRSSTAKKGTVFVLLGPPGVGKTSLAKGIAECFRKPFAEISCRDKNPVDLAGIDRMYDGARHGEFMDTNCRYRGDFCLLLDEFDKMCVDLKEGNTSSLFDTVFDDRKFFCDRFSKFPCPVDNIVFVITCNDMSGVSEPIRNRFQGNIFTIPEFDYEKKAQIGEKFIVPQYMKKHNFTESDVIFTMDGLLSIAKTTTDSGARVMAQQVENLLGVVNNRIEYGDPTPIVVDKAFVSKYAEKVFSDSDIDDIKVVKGFCA